MHEIVLKNMTSKDRRFNETMMSETLCRKNVCEIFERRTVMKILHVLTFKEDGATQSFLRKELLIHRLPESYFTRTIDTKTGRQEQDCKIIGYQYVVSGIQLFVVRTTCHVRKISKPISS